MTTSTTIYDISRELGLSPATVSRALNHPDQVRPETRARVLRFIEKTGFQKRTYASVHKKTEIPHQNSAHAPSFLMSIPSARNPFYGDIIEGAMAAASQHSCQLYVDYSPLTERTLQAFLSRIPRSCQGILCLQPLSAPMVRLITAQFPVVQCSESSPEFTEVSTVTIDDITAEKKAVEYLISLGCRSFSFFTPMAEYRFAEDRLLGFRAALEQAMLPFSDSQIVHVPGMEYQPAYDAAVSHLQKTRPDAVICISDVFAAACVNAAHALSIRVPDDIMVIGFDNISVSMATSPALTTIAQPRFQLGFSAFETLYRESHDPRAEKTALVLPTELLIRGSTAHRR